MISIEEAKKVIGEQQYPRKTEVVSIHQLEVGAVLAEDIVSPVDLPLFSNAMMDGYVVSSLSSSYEVIGEIRAGDTENYLLPAGKSYRIFTGAKVPDGSLAVIMQEKASLSGNKVTFSDEVTAGKNIRLKGDEVQANAMVLAEGTIISPGLLGFLAKMGVQDCKVYQKPTIAVLTTGDECKPVGSSLKSGQIYESNSLMLEQALAVYGYTLSVKNHCRDTFEETKNMLANLMSKVDVLLVTGGISVGDHDYVGRCLIDLGVTELFYKVNQKPGKPLFFGRKGNCSVLGLPGNPASALTCFYQYGLAICRNYSGYRQEDLFLLPVSMKLATDYKKTGSRPEFVRSEYKSNGTVLPLTGQRSSMLHSYARANCLLYLSAGPQDLIAGQEVLGYLL